MVSRDMHKKQYAFYENPTIKVTKKMTPGTIQVIIFPVSESSVQQDTGPP